VELTRRAVRASATADILSVGGPRLRLTS
jgi:hypothetical protein